MNENRPPQEDGPPDNYPPQIVSLDADAEQLQIPIPPADGMSLGEWIEWMPKGTQYRTRWKGAA